MDLDALLDRRSICSIVRDRGSSACGYLIELPTADRTAVTVTFSQYYAEVGPRIPIASNRKNCRLTFGVT